MPTQVYDDAGKLLPYVASAIVGKSVGQAGNKRYFPVAPISIVTVHDADFAPIGHNAKLLAVVPTSNGKLLVARFRQTWRGSGYVLPVVNADDAKADLLEGKFWSGAEAVRFLVRFPNHNPANVPMKKGGTSGGIVRVPYRLPDSLEFANGLEVYVSGGTMYGEAKEAKMKEIISFATEEDFDDDAMLGTVASKAAKAEAEANAEALILQALEAEAKAKAEAK